MSRIRRAIGTREGRSGRPTHALVPWGSLPPVLVLLWILFGSTLTPDPLSAQVGGGWHVGAQGSAGLFVGGGSDFLDAGLGADLTFARDVAPHLRIRADAVLMGLDDQVQPFERADNRIAAVAVGPEVHASAGRLGFYLRGLVGRAANMQVRTSSPLEERTTWASVYGGGIGLRLHVGPSLAIDVGGDILKLGELDFARTSISSLALLEDPVVLRVRAGIWLAVG